MFKICIFTFVFDDVVGTRSQAAAAAGPVVIESDSDDSDNDSDDSSDSVSMSDSSDSEDGDPDAYYGGYGRCYSCGNTCVLPQLGKNSLPTLYNVKIESLTPSFPYFSPALHEKRVYFGDIYVGYINVTQHRVHKKLYATSDH